MAPDEYLKKPYGRVVIPESGGSFRAEIIEFPGCIAVGDTAAEALANLETTAASWLEATIAKRQRVPEPTETVGFSGKLVLRLPKSLHKKAAYAASRQGVSLNSFIVTSIAQQIGSSQPHAAGTAFHLWAMIQPQTHVYISLAYAGGFGAAQEVIAASSGMQMTGVPMMQWPERQHA